RGVADGEALFFLRQKTCGDRSLQSAAETRLHDHHRAGRAVGADWDRNLETGAIFVASLADGRIPLGAPVALPGDVGDAGVRVRTPGHGGASRLEQFRVHADGLEERSGVLTRRERWRKPMW